MNEKNTAIALKRFEESRDLWFVLNWDNPMASVEGILFNFEIDYTKDIMGYKKEFFTNYMGYKELYDNDPTIDPTIDPTPEYTFMRLMLGLKRVKYSSFNYVRLTTASGSVIVPFIELNGLSIIPYVILIDKLHSLSTATEQIKRIQSLEQQVARMGDLLGIVLEQVGEIKDVVHDDKVKSTDDGLD